MELSVILNDGCRYKIGDEIKLIKINQLTVDDIIKQVNNLEYKSTYFYKGDKDEK